MMSNAALSMRLPPIPHQIHSPSCVASCSFHPLRQAQSSHIASFSAAVGGCVSNRAGFFQERTTRWRIRAAENEQGIQSDESEVDIEELEARLGVGSKRKTKRQVEVVAPKKGTKGKAWDDMTLSEKAWSLYIGEKGLLFWINKLSYILIFAIAGGWICFRFVGPALGLYQLEGDILPPSQVLMGS